MLKTVEELKKQGFAIHWLKPNSKAPIANKWASIEPPTLEQLKESFRKNNNVGVRLGKWSKLANDYFLHVVDMDVKQDTEENREEALEALSVAFPEWETYPVVQSGSMGSSRHFYIVCSQAFPSKMIAHAQEKFLGSDGKWHWKWEIELFGTGKQVAMPPSLHPDTGKPYRWLREFDFEALEWLSGPIVKADILDALTGGIAEQLDDDDERIKPLGLSLDESREILSKLPRADYCDDRYGWLAVGMALHHEYKGSLAAFDVWINYSKQSEKFDKKDQKRVWKSFKTKARPLRMASLQSVAREADLEMEFENLEDDVDDLDENFTERLAKPQNQTVLENFMDNLLGVSPEEQAEIDETPRAQRLKKAEKAADLGVVPPKIARLNRKHAIAFIAGKTAVITEHTDGFVSYGTTAALHEWYANDRVATEKSTEPVSQAWVRHKLRREYPNGVIFAPNREAKGYYNHWKGFDVEPDDSASCKRILHHIKHIMCAGIATNYEYLLGWMAHMIQKPEDKPGVAVAIRGAKGAGKDTVPVYISRMFKQHYIKVSHQDHVTGKFNQHQQKCLFLHVEEGFWAGNKNAEGQLKSLITSESVFIEPKGLNGFNVPSVMRIFMTSNEDWVVPVSADERRYFVVDIDPMYSRVGLLADKSTVYFEKLREEMNDGGVSALLHYLQNYDISNFDVRRPPDTTALAHQKLEGLKNVEKWWLDQLMSGQLLFDTFDTRGPATGSVDWHDKMSIAPKALVLDAYENWIRKRKWEGEPLSEVWFARRWKALAPSIGKVRGIADEEGDRRTVYYRIPWINVLRQEFAKAMNSQFEWPDDTIETVDVDDDDM